MRRFFLLAIFTCLSFINVMTAWSNTPYSFPEERINTFAEVNDDWILLGEVTLSNYYSGYEPIIAKLYVREIAKKLIYRVEYQGEFYATRWHDDSKTYHVTINGKTYRCDVPVSTSDNDKEKSKSAKFVGKWGSGGSNWLVEISYDGGSYHFKLNTSNDYTRSVISENSNEVIYTWEWKIDHSIELRKKGWRCYSDERNNDADPGYPTSGRYEYDREVVLYTESISLQDSGPLLKGIKKHCYYYLQGILTYAETNTDFSTHDFPITLKRF